MSGPDQTLQADRAVLTDCSGRQWSFDALQEAVRQIGSSLSHLKIGSADRVAILLDKSFGSVAAIYACTDLTVTYIPVDASSPAERILHILTDAAPRAVIHDSSFHFEDKAAECVLLSNDAELHITLFPKPDNSVTVSPPNIAYILYTSGSTGSPKGVCVAHEAADAFVSWCITTFSITASDHIASIAPFHFDLSVCDLFAARRTGATLHLFRNQDVQNVRLMAERLSEKKITFIYATPTFFSALIQFGKTEKYEWSSIRRVLFAGEVFPVGTLHLLISQWSHAQFFNLYGPTETNVCTFAEIVKDELRTEPYPIGKPCPHHEVEITPEGELSVGGPHVAHGYLNQDELTAHRFFTRNGKRWFRTGDRVETDTNGSLVFRGRIDRMIKRRGYRIEPAEIETALQKIEGIVRTAVIPYRSGEELKLIAVIVPGSSRTFGIMEVKSALQAYLPDYMLPDHVVMIGEFPVTSSGKIDYMKLQEEIVSSF